MNRLTHNDLLDAITDKEAIALARNEKLWVNCTPFQQYEILLTHIRKYGKTRVRFERVEDALAYCAEKGLEKAALYEIALNTRKGH